MPLLDFTENAALRFYLRQVPHHSNVTSVVPRDKVVEFCEVAGYWYSSEDAHGITVHVCHDNITGVLGQQDHQGQQIGEDSTHQGSHPNFKGLPVPRCGAQC